MKKARRTRPTGNLFERRCKRGKCGEFSRAHVKKLESAWPHFFRWISDEPPLGDVIREFLVGNDSFALCG